VTTDRTALQDKVALFPQGPGVYTFLDARGKVIYVGKAKSLRARVRSYLREDGHDGRAYYALLVKAIADVACFATSTEKEALLLENTLIKRHRPRWNIKLTDDKAFLQIEVTTDRPWPHARLVRTSTRDKTGQVFGPYASARAVRETLRHLKRWFPLRTCSDAELRQRTRPCIEHEMGRCGAPCVGKVTTDEYGRVVQDVLLFLGGRDDTLLPRLRERMQALSQELKYEQAARVRDQVTAIERTLEHQKVARDGSKDQDAFGVAAHDGLVVVFVVQVREGQVVEPRTYELRTPLPIGEALNAFLGQYYAATDRYVPHEVLLPRDVEDRALLEEVLTERRGTKVEVKASLRTDRRGLVELAEKNAALALATGEEKHAATRELLASMQERFGLSRLPRRIECFDISTIQGAFTVASKVRFADGAPDPQGYRTYRVRTVEGQDDFAAMEEVVGRRIASGLEDGDLPDLIVVDGGAAQLQRALTAAARAGLPPQRTDIVGLAKARYVPDRQDGGRLSRDDDAGGETGDAETAPAAPTGPAAADEPLADRAHERVYLPRGGPPVLLEPASLESRFLARIRDAAHRAAIRFHRDLRRKAALRSGLEELPGVGPKRRADLLARFGSLKGVREATLDELAQVLPRAVAEGVRSFFDAHAPGGEAIPNDP
jgi:excinuclease ABC subunit C